MLLYALSQPTITSVIAKQVNIMNISEAAKKTGLTSKAIRFYEEKGLLSKPLRGDNGYRFYHAKQIEELSLLSQARQVGFTLDECRELLALFRDKSRHSADVKQRALAKVMELEQRIAELNAMRRHLLALAEQCPGDASASCPIIDGLTACGRQDKG